MLLAAIKVNLSSKTGLWKSEWGGCGRQAWSVISYFYMDLPLHLLPATYTLSLFLSLTHLPQPRCFWRSPVWTCRCFSCPDDSTSAFMCRPCALQSWEELAALLRLFSRCRETSQPQKWGRSFYERQVQRALKGATCGHLHEVSHLRSSDGGFLYIH